MPLDETPLLIEQSLYFEQILRGGKSQLEFQAFVDNVITPRFPAGLTIFDARQKEDTKVVSLYVEDTWKSEAAINEIIKGYHQQFQGASILQVTNKDDVKVGFGVGENLIDNDNVPELIQVDLFFGRNIKSVGEVSQAEFQAFLDNVVTPRFSAGLTVFDTNGQFQDSKGTIVEEPSKVVSLIIEDTKQNEAYLDEIVETYMQQFQQESVLQAVNEDVTVSFGSNDNIIDNDAVPELIQVDLFFGRNIGSIGKVSQAEFQAFLDNVVSPRFSELTVFDANGQFQDSTGAIIEEQSKVVSLVFEDTEQNEAYINRIVKEYKQKFQQESVLIVVDEDIKANAVATIGSENPKFEILAWKDNTFTEIYSLSEAIAAGELYNLNGLITGISPDKSLVVPNVKAVISTDQNNLSLQHLTFDWVISNMADSSYFKENLGIGVFNILQPGLEFDFAPFSLAPDTFTIGF